MNWGSSAATSRETQEYLQDTIDEWRKALAARASGLTEAFAPDAHIHVVQVNLRDAPDEAARRRLLQVPTAFSISQDEVSALIQAGGDVLHQSPEFRALMGSLGAPLPARVSVPAVPVLD